MVAAAEKFQPDVVLCPFLTARIPESVFTKVCHRFPIDMGIGLLTL